MKQYSECPNCKRTKYRIVKGLCQSCYATAFNKARAKPRKYPKDIPLTDLQVEFLTGCLLGDGWLSNLKYGRKSPNFGIDRKLDDLEYLKWQYNFVSNLCLREILIKDRFNKATKKIKKHCIFETRFLPSLLELRKLWYPNDIKIVPKDLKLTKLIMQIWYCDDGGLEVISPTSFRIKFSTHGFSTEDCNFLIRLLEQRYGKGFSLTKDGKNKDQYYIRANHAASIIILNDLKEDFPPGMTRKFNDSLVLKLMPNMRAAKLQQQDVLSIRDEFAKNSSAVNVFIKNKSIQYNVSVKTIKNIIYKKTWRDI